MHAFKIYFYTLILTILSQNCFAEETDYPATHNPHSWSAIQKISIECPDNSSKIKGWIIKKNTLSSPITDKMDLVREYNKGLFYSSIVCTYKSNNFADSEQLILQQDIVGCMEDKTYQSLSPYLFGITYRCTSKANTSENCHIEECLPKPDQFKKRSAG